MLLAIRSIYAGRSIFFLRSARQEKWQDETRTGEAIDDVN
jgi:hypothetical protein